MESALRVVLLLAAVGLGLWLPKYLYDNPVHEDLERLNNELSEFESENQTIRDANEGYRTLVRGLREDPRIVDRRARAALGMSRADELVIWFDQPQHASNSFR